MHNGNSMSSKDKKKTRAPTAVYEWSDPKPTGAKGWVVMDTIINGVSGGGIFMSANATCEETADIARNMSKKFTVCDPQIGGAKGGIRFDHRDPRAESVLHRFILSNRLLLENVWVTAGDLNTSDRYIEKVIQEDIGNTTCQSVLGKAIAKSRNGRDRSGELARLIGHPANDYFPLIEGAVGYGLAASVRTAVTLSGRVRSSGLPRIIIQGFGAVGSSLAFYLERDRIATVVAIADKDGFIHDPAGLPVAKLLSIRKERRKQLEQGNASQQALSECDKNIFVNLSEIERKQFNGVSRTGMTDSQFLINLVKSEQAEVFSACAGRYAITREVLDALVAHTWKSVAKGQMFVINGANNSFGVVDGQGKLVEDKAGQLIDHLSGLGVSVVPDWVANSGTAQLFHRGLSLDFDFGKPAVAEDVLKACAMPIERFLTQAFKSCSDHLPSLPRSCEDLAAHRLSEPVAIGEEPRTPAFAPLASMEVFESKDEKGEVLAPASQRQARCRYALPPMPASKMLSFDERYQRCLSVACNEQECIQPDELRQLLTVCPNPVAYDGFEPSGRMHIAQGLLKRVLVDRLTSSGFTYLFWVADWFAKLNHKMGGDLTKIQTVGKYFIEVWKAAGMDMDRVRFLWASDEINKNPDEYWQLVLDIATKNSLTRIQRCNQIMGRKDQESLSASHILYPCMQCADVFFLGVDVCQLGLDQRKVNVLAREYAEDAKEHTKPIILSHTMLPGLKKGQEKMSKSDPNSAIFMEDEPEDVQNKINSAWCPLATDEGNPCTEYLKHIVFALVSSVEVETSNGPMSFAKYSDFIQVYKEDKISPKQLKTCLVFYINQLLQPVRNHFKNDPNASVLLATVRRLRAEAVATEQKETKDKPSKKEKKAKEPKASKDTSRVGAAGGKGKPVDNSEQDEPESDSSAPASKPAPTVPQMNGTHVANGSHAASGTKKVKNSKPSSS